MVCDHLSWRTKSLTADSTNTSEWITLSWQKWQPAYSCPFPLWSSEVSLKVHTRWRKTCSVMCPVSDFLPSQSCLCAWAQWEDGKGLPGCSVSYPLSHRYAAPVPDGLGREKHAQSSQEVKAQPQKASERIYRFGQLAVVGCYYAKLISNLFQHLS